jgi:hypothetical protein
LGLVADEIKARPPESASAIGRQLGAIGGLGKRLLTRCAVARAIELRVLRTRPLPRQRLARLSHRGVQVGQLCRCVGIDGAARERFQTAQRGAAVRAQRIGLLALLEQGRFDGGGIGRDGGAFANAGVRFAQARLVVGDRRVEDADLLLQQGRGEERLVHFLPHGEERAADARLRLGKLRALDRLFGRDGQIEHRFLRVEVGVVGVLRRRGDADAGDRELDRRDGRLVLRLAVGNDRRPPGRGDVSQSQIGR